MHKNWCGKSCCECQERCSLDEALYCSPDCEHLGREGEMNSKCCSVCDAYIAFCEDNVKINTI